MKSFLVSRYLFSLGIAALIFYYCTAPVVPSVIDEETQCEIFYDGDDWVMSYRDLRDYMAHLIVFGALSFSLALETLLAKLTSSFRTKRMWVMALLIPILYGGLIELIQQNFFPPRSAEWTDWLADALGCAIGFGVAALCAPRLVDLILKFLKNIRNK
ncbi:MAG: VanZ family protein [Paludibacteraceae bacterium]|nr:VanZ family protein [Paludibacteraceae bacterium]